MTTAFGFTAVTRAANTSLSACDTISPLVITTKSADFSIGPIFLGVLMPERLSMIQTPLISAKYGEQRLQSPADSVINKSN